MRVSHLTVINAILFVTENGCKWRALPPRFGKWRKGLHPNASLGRRRRS
ncbi:MAG: transposase [Marinovum sp.]|nr:transposase [Marinovum sp.]